MARRVIKHRKTLEERRQEYARNFLSGKMDQKEANKKISKKLSDMERENHLEVYVKPHTQNGHKIKGYWRKK